MVDLGFTRAENHSKFPKDDFFQIALQKNYLWPKNGGSFHVLLTSTNQILSIEVRRDKTVNYYQHTLKI